MVRSAIIILAIGALLLASYGLLHDSIGSPDDDPPSEWLIDESMSNIGIFMVDYESSRLKRAYFTRQSPCTWKRHHINDEVLVSRARGLFEAVDDYWSPRVVEGEDGTYEVLDTEVTHAGDLALLEMNPGVSGGVAISHACTGLVLFAGSIVWRGRGTRLYPAVPLAPDSLRETGGTVADPQQLDVITGARDDIDTAGAIAAWDAVRKLNLVQELGTGPYDVLIYLYRRQVGDFKLEHADWVIVVHRHPDPGSQGPTPTPCPTRPPQPTSTPVPTYDSYPVAPTQDPYPKPAPPTAEPGPCIEPSP